MDNIKNDKYYIDKILECIKIIRDVYNGKDDLETNVINNSTIMFQFIMIGEYSKNLSIEYKESKTNIDWNKIIGMRNVVVHEYDKVRYDVIDDTIINDLQKLKEELLK